jgi:hypothetical protein
MPARTRPLVPLLVAALFLAGGCRLPAREWRWEVSGADRTFLDALGGARGCGLALELWAAPREMWPLPLPGSRPLFLGGEDLYLLALLRNDGAAAVSLDPARARVRLGGAPEALATESSAAACGAKIAAGKKGACGFTLRLPRGTKALEVDLRDSAECRDSAFVFRLSRQTAWRWRRVGPGVPGL